MLFARKLPTLEPTKAWAGQQRNDLVLVDVREKPEWRSGVVGEAMRIPLHELSRRIDELPRDRTVAFLCRSGHRSLLAARKARRHGLFTAGVEGGMLAWSGAGLPMAKPPREE